MYILICDLICDDILFVMYIQYLICILFVNNDTRTCHSDGTDMFIDINTYF